MNKNKSKIILIGANGFFGKNLKDNLQRNFDIICYTRKSKLTSISLNNVSHIINCAAEVYNDNLMFDSNLKLVDKILKKIVKENKKCRLIHFGSSAEYGLLKKPAKETDPLKPRTAYEATKAASCMMVEGYSKQLDLKSVIIRPFSIYGQHENLTRLIPNIFRHFLYGDKLSIYGGYHDFVYVNDLMRFINSLIKKDDSFFDGKIINFGSGKQYSNLKVLRVCEQVFKKKANCEIINNFQRSYDGKIWVSNNKYLIKNIGYSFNYDLVKGIKSYLNFVKKKKINLKIVKKSKYRRIQIK